MTATAVPRGEYWVGNESALSQLVNGSSELSDQELRSRLTAFVKVDMNMESLACLLALARKGFYFTEDFKNMFKTISQIQVKSIREAWATKKEECEAIKTGDKALSSQLLLNLANSFASEINFLFSLVKEICDLHLNSEKIADHPDDVLFYKKIKADYSRYRAEISKTPETIKDAVQCNDEILNYAKSLNLPINNPAFLGVILNCSVHYKETLNDTQGAIKFVEEYWEQGNNFYNNSSEKNENDKGLCILGLMKENIDLWKKELEEDAATAPQ